MGPDPIPPYTLPAYMQALRNALDAAGFRLIHEEYDRKAFGNLVVVFQRGRRCVRFVRDRSQWWADVSGPDCSKYYLPGFWESYLGGEVRRYYAPTLEQCAGIVTTRLADMLGAAEADPDLQGHLDHFEREWSHMVSARARA